MNGKWDRVLWKFLEGTPGQWVGFVAAAVAISVAAWWVSRYRASLRGDAGPAAEGAQLVRHLRELKERGQMSETEYRSLRSRLASSSGGTGLPVTPLEPDAAGGRDRHVSPSPGSGSDPEADEGPA